MARRLAAHSGVIAWVLVGQLLGCATRVVIDVRDVDAIADMQRWSWLDPVEAPAGDDPSPRPLPPRDPTTPAGRAPAGLHGRMVQSVERALIQRGYVKATEAPEFQVALEVRMRVEVEERQVASAIGFLPSMGYTPSYDYQTFEREELRYERASVVLLLTDAETGRLLWRGRLEGRYSDEFVGHVEDVVIQLLRGLPWALRPLEPAPYARPEPATAGLRGPVEAVSLCGRSYDEQAAREHRP